MILIVIIAAVVIVGMAMVGLDFARFSKGKANANSAHCDSGGDLVIRKTGTYYIMPNGVERKISTRLMDLSPNSPDMRMFTAIMDKARTEHEDEMRATKRKEYVEMQKIAAEVNA